MLETICLGMQKTMSLSLVDVTIADALLMHFLKHIKHLYSDSSITPNMHMQCHLSDCIKDCGPFYRAFGYLPLKDFLEIGLIIIGQLKFNKLIAF